MPRIPRRPSEEARRGAYKPPGLDAGRSRRRREDLLLALRRRNRDAGLFKRRRDEPNLAPAPLGTPSEAAAPATDGTVAPPPPSGPAPPAPPGVDSPRTAADSELDGLSELVDKVWSDDTSTQLEATVQFRKLLSDGKNSTMIKIIRADVLPRFAEFLSKHGLPQLQMEAAWVLTNIAASDYTMLVAECGAVPKLVDLLASPNASIRHQATWALGNIAADMPSCRETVLDHGAVTPLLDQFKEDMKVSALRTATWALSNLCFGKLPDEVQVKPILDIISLLIHSADEKILADACWTLYYICDGVEGGVQDVLGAGVCPQLVKLLMHTSANVLLPVITSLARISAGDDTQVQVFLPINISKTHWYLAVINAKKRLIQVLDSLGVGMGMSYLALTIILEKGILPCLAQLLARNYPMVVKKQACLIVSNIAAGSKDQIQAVIDADVMNHVIVLLKTSETDIQKEAAWAISNAASGGSSDQIQCFAMTFSLSDLRYLVSRGCLEPLCNVLKYQDVDLVYTCLEGLQNILEEGEIGKQGKESTTNPYALFMLENGGLENLEDLQDFDNDAVYRLAMKLLESYWDEEVSDDDATLPAPVDCPEEPVVAVPEDAAQRLVPVPAADETE